jgi:hypothetical protein
MVGCGSRNSPWLVVRVEPDSEAVGTAMRPSRFRSIARKAGWSDVEILRIDHPFWRFYRLNG